MRIRNRKVPFPISSLCPGPICSDPSFSHSSVVQLQPDKHLPSEYSDAGDASALSGAHPPDHFIQTIGDCGALDDAKVLAKEDDSSNISWNDETHGAKIECTTVTSADQEIKETMADARRISTKGAKRKGRGGALLEGSRCSRVNGRGWRCCQPTLVGYSLCEHHLGKGRLKSISNVRKSAKSELSEACSPPLERGSTSEKKALPSSKKKIKLGVVKARSLSSLLGIAKEVVSMDDGEN